MSLCKNKETRDQLATFSSCSVCIRRWTYSTSVTAVLHEKALLLVWEHTISRDLQNASKQDSSLFSQAKCSYYRAFSAVYGKVGSVVSEPLRRSLPSWWRQTCLPVLYYAFEAGPLNKSAITALDYILFTSFCHKKAVLSQGEPRDAAINIDTYWNLQRHSAVFTAIAQLSCYKISKSRQKHGVKYVCLFLLPSNSLSYLQCLL